MLEEYEPAFRFDLLRRRRGILQDRPLREGRRLLSAGAVALAVRLNFNHIRMAQRAVYGKFILRSSGGERRTFRSSCAEKNKQRTFVLLHGTTLP